MSFEAFRAAIRARFDAWQALRLSDLQYRHAVDAESAVVALLAFLVFLIVARSVLRRARGSRGLSVPALLPTVRFSSFSLVRLVPALLFLVGLPFAVLALADPLTPLIMNEVTFPGRRISVMVDASASMRSPFKTETLKPQADVDSAFFTAVAAAEQFIRLRMQGKYRDLLALVEFGNEAYVVTPFTNDYENILLSISLIGDPVEYSLFPDPGTIIANAIDQSVALFKAFNFLDASGNAMVLFTDGEDTRTIVNNRTLDEIVQATVDAHIPVYMIRTNYQKETGKIVPDQMWIRAIEKTGGRFFAADNEASLLAAIHEIDQLSAGTIRSRQYSAQRPQFAVFALMAAGCWLAAAAARLMVPAFRTVP